MALIVKNTFYEVDESNDAAPAGSRRASSLPRAWKPMPLELLRTPSDAPSDAPCDVPGGAHSDASTAASSEDEGADAGAKRRVSARDLVVRPKGTTPLRADAAHWAPSAPKTRLRASADAFTPLPLPVPPPPPNEELGTVLTATRLALLQCCHVRSVKTIGEASLGAFVTILVELIAGASRTAETETLALAQGALIAATERSNSTYLLGYQRQPFVQTTIDGRAAVEATIGSVPASLHDSVCWDTYRKGFCPRLATCRWCHPTSADLTQLSVALC